MIMNRNGLPCVHQESCVVSFVLRSQQAVHAFLINRWTAIWFRQVHSVSDTY